MSACECNAEITPCTQDADGDDGLCEVCRDQCRYWPVKETSS